MLKTFLAVGGLSLCLSATANIVTSNQADCWAGTGRVFSIDANTVLRCMLAGPGNINGNNAGDAPLINSGWVFIDSSVNTDGAHDGWLGSVGSLSSGIRGDFRINPAAYSHYDRIAIGFKSGVAQADPDWAIFELADNTLNGLWSISGSQQALSHAMLYGYGRPTVVDLPPPSVGDGPPQLVSEPQGWLLAAAAAALLAVVSHRRRKG
jgi:hypothetical protein